MDYSDFRTLKGYRIKNHKKLTDAMEDYLEMICRHSKENECIHINNLAAKLNVKPSSASKMVSKLNEMGYVEYQKYGTVKPTEMGIEMGEYLLYRHNTVNKFLCIVNSSIDETEQAEQIEHFFDNRTVKNLERLIEYLIHCDYG